MLDIAGAGTTPRLSIVTINLDNAAGLEKTIESVRARHRTYVEYIVIDGGSQDSSIDVIRRRNGEIDYWVSEHDAGIYDAMNKGAAAARGEFICFMNSGDAFHPDALQELMERYDEWRDCDVVYGNILNATLAHVDRARDPSQILTDLPFCHQAAFVRTDLQRRFPFDTSYRVAADYDFMLRLYFDGYRFFRTDICVGEYDASGLSHRQYFGTMMEYALILWRRSRGVHRLMRVGRYAWGKKEFVAYLLANRALGERKYRALVNWLKRRPVEHR